LHFHVPALASSFSSSARYTAVSFLPRFLFEQFNKVANQYFFFICVLTLMAFSPKDPASFTVTFAGIITVSAIKEVYEDSQRAAADKELNGRQALVMRSSGSGEFTAMAWSDIRCGDLVKVLDNESFPCDLLFVSSSDSSGVCYVDTCNLDGETNLKSKMALPLTNKFRDASSMVGIDGESEGVGSFSCLLNCETPNEDLYVFKVPPSAAPSGLFALLDRLPVSTNTVCPTMSVSTTTFLYYVSPLSVSCLREVSVAYLVTQLDHAMKTLLALTR
jgi:magnesium-transporting ATPase (P-type)